MSSCSSFPCLGGPADGQWRTIETGVYRMFVAEVPEPCVTPYEQGTMPENSSIKTHEYWLMKDNHGQIAWVHSSLIGKVK